MGPKSNDQCPYKSEAEADQTDRRGDISVTTGAKIAVMWPPET